MLKISSFVGVFMLWSGMASADHSMQDVLNWTRNTKGNNLYQAVMNLQKAIGKDTVCDFTNSIQMPVPTSEANLDIWRQMVLCFANESELKRGHQWLLSNPLASYGRVGTYGLMVSSVMDITYQRSEGLEGETEDGDSNKIKLIAISYK